MKKWLFVFLSLGGSLYAQDKTGLSLSEYLNQVKSRNPEARSLVDSAASYEMRMDEAQIPLSPELYAQYGLFDDKKQQAQPSFMGDETRGQKWRAGLRTQTKYGLSGDLYFNAQRTIISGASPQFLQVPDYMESTAVLQLNQSLWRNSFGESTRADLLAKRAVNDMSRLQARFNLKNLLLSAQNTYWSLVSYNQIEKLQRENVERAKQTRDRMTRGSRLRLFDDTDAMQAQAAFETRALELQTSLDERSALIRQFNTLRGLDSDELGTLDELPSTELMAGVAKVAQGRMSREDFEMLRAQAKATVAQARFAQSQLQPQLDLQASVATNGRDGLTSRSYDLAQTNKYPGWTIGVNFSLPLDFGLVRDVRKGFHSATRSAESLNEQAQFSEVRAWEDLTRQKKEAQGRYERSLSVEKIQTELVKRNRTRLNNGRTTTFEALNIEQGLALAQIGRVRAQLALLQIHNALQTFEAKP